MVIGLRIPPHAEILVEKKQKVTLEDALIKLGSKDVQHIDVARALHIKPEKIFQYILVQVGDTISKGDVLAQKKHLLSSTSCTSQLDGVITAIDHTTGSISVSTDSSSMLTLQSCVEGVVDSISEDDSLLYVDIGSAEAYSATCDQDCGGKLVQLTPRDYYSCDADDVQGGCIHMLTSPTHITSKMEALGARCIMAVEGPESDIPYIRISAEDSDKISKSSKSHVVYSLHDQKVYIYSPSSK